MEIVCTDESPLLLSYDPWMHVPACPELCLRSLAFLQDALRAFHIECLPDYDDQLESIMRSIIVGGGNISVEIKNCIVELMHECGEIVNAELQIVSHLNDRKEVEATMHHVLTLVCSETMVVNQEQTESYLTAKDLCSDIVEQLLSKCWTNECQGSLPEPHMELCIPDEFVIPLTLDMDEEAAVQSGVELEVHFAPADTSTVVLPPSVQDTILSVELPLCAAEGQLIKNSNLLPVKDIEALTTADPTASPLDKVPTGHAQLSQGRIEQEYHPIEQPQNDLSSAPTPASTTARTQQEVDEAAFEALWNTRKTAVEKTAEARAGAQFRHWQRERVSVEAAIDASLREYAELYEKAHALRLLFEEEKRVWAVQVAEACRKDSCNQRVSGGGWAGGGGWPPPQQPEQPFDHQGSERRCEEFQYVVEEDPEEQCGDCTAHSEAGSGSSAAMGLVTPEKRAPRKFVVPLRH